MGTHNFYSENNNVTSIHLHTRNTKKKNCKKRYYHLLVRPKKRRKPYLRYLWLDLNKTKTGINNFKNTIGTM
jgi:hypothetical protein